MAQFVTSFSIMDQAITKNSSHKDLVFLFCPIYTEESNLTTWPQRHTNFWSFFIGFLCHTINYAQESTSHLTNLFVGKILFTDLECNANQRYVFLFYLVNRGEPISSSFNTPSWITNPSQLASIYTPSYDGILSYLIPCFWSLNEVERL